MANIHGILRTQKWQNIYFEDQIKLCFKTQALQIEEVSQKIFTLKLEQDMKPN